MAETITEKSLLSGQTDKAQENIKSKAPTTTLGLNKLFSSIVHYAIIVASGTWVLATVIYVAWSIFTDGDHFKKLFWEHSAATLGIPMAGLTSASLVIIFRVVSGPIEFEGLGFTFKGAGAPIVFWIFVFAAQIFAITQCWGLAGK